MSDDQNSPPARLKAISPSFAVRNIVETAEHYRDKLGFKILGYFADPPVYAMVRRGDVEIHFGHTTASSVLCNWDYRGSVGIDAYVWVDDIEKLFVELTGRGATIVEGPVTRVYQAREIVVRDLNGFTIAFGMDVSGH